MRISNFRKRNAKGAYKNLIISIENAQKAFIKAKQGLDEEDFKKRKGKKLCELCVRGYFCDDGRSPECLFPNIMLYSNYNVIKKENEND